MTGAGWHIHNASSPVGSNSWFQGNGVVFAAHDGGPNDYVGANYNSAGSVGTVSNWLMLPEQDVKTGDRFAFWTRSADHFFTDRLEVRLSLSGASTNVGATAESVGDFERLLHSVNPDLTADGYPTEWERIDLDLSDIPHGSSGRIAFRYFVTESGPAGVNGNYIGIDSVSYLGAVAAVEADAEPLPETTIRPGTTFSTLLRVDLAASGSTAAISGLTLHAADLRSSSGGVVLLDQVIGNVRVFAGDVNADGLLPGTVSFGGSTATVTLTAPLVLDVNGAATVFVTADAAPSPSSVVALSGTWLGGLALLAMTSGLLARRRRAWAVACALIALSVTACGSAPRSPVTVSFTAQLTAMDTDAGAITGLPVTGAAVTVEY